MVRLIATCTALTGVLMLAAACDGGASAVPVPRQTAEAPATYEPASGGETSTETRRAPVPKVDGKPMWSANRRFTAEQNARRQFERDGADFGAKSVDDFVSKAHDFVSDPPKGSATIKRRNGDTLIYDPAGNTFAVATRDGAPRTMFKPDEGAAYWEKVKTREAEGGASRRSSDRS